jgi:hypothetical protein
MLRSNLLKAVLTPEQRRAGLVVSDSEDFVILTHGHELVGRYSSLGVTINDIRQDADTYLNGIQIKKVTIEDMDDTISQIRVLVDTLKR